MDQMDTSQAALTPTKVSSGFSFKGLIDVIASPTKFYEKLKDNPKVLVPTVAIFLISALATFAQLDIKLDMIIEGMRDSGQMTDGQIRDFSDQPFFPLMPYIDAVLFMAVAFMTAGLASLFGGFVMGGKAKYWQLVAVMAYAEFVYFASSLVSLPIEVMKETLVPSFSLAVLAPGLALKDPLFVLLSKISAPFIWEIVVAGIGLSIVFNFSRNKGYLLAVLSLGMLSVLHILSAVVGQLAQ